MSSVLETVSRLLGAAPALVVSTGLLALESDFKQGRGLWGDAEQEAAEVAAIAELNKLRQDWHKSPSKVPDAGIVLSIMSGIERFFDQKASLVETLSLVDVHDGEERRRVLVSSLGAIVRRLSVYYARGAFSEGDVGNVVQALLLPKSLPEVSSLWRGVNLSGSSRGAYCARIQRGRAEGADAIGRFSSAGGLGASGGSQLPLIRAYLLERFEIGNVYSALLRKVGCFVGRDVQSSGYCRLLSANNALSHGRLLQALRAVESLRGALRLLCSRVEEVIQLVRRDREVILALTGQGAQSALLEHHTSLQSNLFVAVGELRVLLQSILQRDLRFLSVRLKNRMDVVVQLNERLKSPELMAQVNWDQLLGDIRGLLVDLSGAAPDLKWIARGNARHLLHSQLFTRRSFSLVWYNTLHNVPRGRGEDKGGPHELFSSHSASLDLSSLLVLEKGDLLGKIEELSRILSESIVLVGGVCVCRGDRAGVNQIQVLGDFTDDVVDRRIPPCISTPRGQLMTGWAERLFGLSGHEMVGIVLGLDVSLEELGNLSKDEILSKVSLGMVQTWRNSAFCMGTLAQLAERGATVEFLTSDLPYEAIELLSSCLELLDLEESDDTDEVGDLDVCFDFDESVFG